MRLVSFARNPYRMTSTSRSVYINSEHIHAVNNNVTNSSTRQIASVSRVKASSSSLDIQELEVLGIQTWKGKAVFTSTTATPIATGERQRHKQSTSTVIDLADQLIDLTLSPSPPSTSTSTANLTRPRGIPRFNSPSARTAYSPSKRRNNAQVQTAAKAIHPFFSQWKETQAAKPGVGRQEQKREASSYSWKRPQSKGQKDAQPNARNPFVSPPVSPVLSASSVRSSPIQPPPASRRPRLAPVSSSSSSSSFSSILSASSSETKSSTSRPAFKGKPVAPQIKPSTQKSPLPNPKVSPLRVIAPIVKKSPNSTGGQKTFKPVFQPSSKQEFTSRTGKSASPPPKAKSAADSPRKWSGWGWNRQQSERNPSPSRVPPIKPKAVAATRPVPKKKNPSSDPAEQLIMEMQQLDLEKEAAGEVATEIEEDSYEFLIAASQVTESLVPENDAEDASTYESLIASSPISQPAPIQQLSQPAAIPQTNSSPAILNIAQPGDFAPSKPPRRNTMFSYKTYHIGHPYYKKPPTMAYTADAQEANELLSMVKGNAIAFDMEWPFTKGRKRVVLPGGKVEMQGWAKQGKTALIQVGDANLIVLVHLSMMKGKPIIRDLTEDEADLSVVQNFRRN